MRGAFLTIYYIGKADTHGASDETGVGSRDNPYASFDAVPDLEPGDSVYFREGTYQNSTYQSLTEKRDTDGLLI